MAMRARGMEIKMRVEAAKAIPPKGVDPREISRFENSMTTTFIIYVFCVFGFVLLIDGVKKDTMRYGTGGGTMDGEDNAD